MRKTQLTEAEKQDLLQKACEIEALGQQAVREVRAVNKIRGIPTVFYKDGAICYELPDGTITQTPPPGFAEREKEYLQVTAA